MILDGKGIEMAREYGMRERKLKTAESGVRFLSMYPRYAVEMGGIAIFLLIASFFIGGLGRSEDIDLTKMTLVGVSL